MTEIDVAERRETHEAEAWWSAPADRTSPLPALQEPRRSRILAVFSRVGHRLRHAIAGRQTLGAAFAEERAYGHFFLFVPVFLA